MSTKVEFENTHVSAHSNLKAGDILVIRDAYSGEQEIRTLGYNKAGHAVALTTDGISGCTEPDFEKVVRFYQNASSWELVGIATEITITIEKVEGVRI
jgi:hypothetical protein